ncbi:hypothetical protein NPIL_312241 [Nephila pilipes]|uniref:Uncharacterized protein n=1 Tax=Nephila pilipes TaxID=299642 RepID=A0A8X6TNK8_NEPPI|nr:hypothetical protein NPIL_312241 [Nephila pilipes]
MSSQEIGALRGVHSTEETGQNHMYSCQEERFFSAVLSGLSWACVELICSFLEVTLRLVLESQNMAGHR